jgi:hypothetical protein
MMPRLMDKGIIIDNTGFLILTNPITDDVRKTKKTKMKIITTRGSKNLISMYSY